MGSPLLDYTNLSPYLPSLLALFYSQYLPFAPVQPCLRVLKCGLHETLVWHTVTGGPRPTSLFTIGAWGRRGGWWWGVDMERGENVDIPVFSDCTEVLKLKRTPRARGQPFEIGFANVWIDGLLKRGNTFQSLSSGLINLGDMPIISSQEIIEMSGLCRISEEPERGVPECTHVNREHYLSTSHPWPLHVLHQTTGCPGTNCRKKQHNLSLVGGYGWGKPCPLDRYACVCISRDGVPTICLLIATTSSFLLFVYANKCRVLRPYVISFVFLGILPSNCFCVSKPRKEKHPTKWGNVNFWFREVLKRTSTCVCLRFPFICVKIK